MADLKLYGNKYEGNFESQIHTCTGYTQGDHYASSYEYQYSVLSGIGIIKNKKTKDKYYFRFGSECTDLRKNILSFENNLEEMLQKIQDKNYPSFIDYLLEGLIELVKKSGKDFPGITIPKLRKSELIENGFIPDDSGQMCFIFNCVKGGDENGRML